MRPDEEVTYIITDCFLAVGQAVGTSKRLSGASIAWWHDHYRECFVTAITQLGTSWARDRSRVISVGRWLGENAARESGGAEIIDIAAALRASAEVEQGCRLNARREANGLPRAKG